MPEALEFLGRIIGADRVAADPRSAERIVLATGLLPLGLQLAGGLPRLVPGGPGRSGPGRDRRPGPAGLACTIAHTIFYLSDYGLRSPGLDLADAERARRIAEELTGHYLEHDEWDNVAKFVLAQCCLGLDPARTPSGAAAIRLLASVQKPSGAIPCAAARLMPDPAATPMQRFRKAYQTTLMTALMSVMASSASR